MKLEIAICDDDQILCKAAKDAIFEMKNEYDIDLYSSVDKLLDSYRFYDAIFLDVEMPEKNGMETAHELRRKGYRGEIIFLTSHSEYMPEAFKVRAFRFLTKPIDRNELEETLEQLENGIKDNERLSVDSFGKELFVYIKDIMYIESRKKNTVLHMHDTTIETLYPLKYWKERMSENDFCQIHKSYIVSLDYISVIEPEVVTLREDDVVLPLSRRRYSIVKQKYFDYVRSHAHTL